MVGKHLMILAISALVCSCQNNGNKALSKSWKYSNGYHLEDLIYFDQVYSIKHDTIFRIDSAVATFKISKNFLSGKDELILTSFVSGEEGVYTEFGNKMSDKIIIEQSPIDVEGPPEETTPEKPQPN